MMLCNRSQYYTRYRQRHVAARTYREKNHDEINARQRSTRQRNMELSRFHYENEYLRETLPDDIPFLSIGTHRGKVELASINYAEALKI